MIYTFIYDTNLFFFFLIKTAYNDTLECLKCNNTLKRHLPMYVIKENYSKKCELSSKEE